MIGRLTTVRTTQRRKNKETKKSIIALLMSIMLVASIVSFTALATTEDTDYIPFLEAVDKHVPSNSETRANFASDNEQAPNSEVNDSDTYESNDSVADDLNTEYLDDSMHSQEGLTDIEIKSDPEDEYDHDYYCELDEYNECVCACDYYCSDDCNCECFHCECYYIEIEALVEFIVTNWDGLLDVFENQMTTVGPYMVHLRCRHQQMFSLCLQSNYQLHRT